MQRPQSGCTSSAGLVCEVGTTLEGVVVAMVMAVVVIGVPIVARRRTTPERRMLLVRYAMSIPVTRPVWLELGPRDEHFLRDAGCPNDLIADGRVDLRQLAARGWLVTESGLISPAAIEQQTRDDPDDVLGRWARESAVYWDRMNGMARDES